MSLLGACLLAAAATGRGMAQPPPDRAVLVLDIKGAIGFVAAGQLAKALERGRGGRSRPAVIVRLDTPGGLLSSTREMIQAILASRVPVIMYVAPERQPGGQRRHLSASTPPTSPPWRPARIWARRRRSRSLRRRAARRAAAEQSRRRDRTSKPEPDHGRPSPSARAINDAIAYIRSLAELRGRNADWAEKAVRDAATLTATAALKERVIDVIAKDVDRPAVARSTADRSRRRPARCGSQTKGRSVVELKPDWKMQLMSVITDPNIALILLMIGIYGILFEFWSPGAVAPGVVGGICLIVALTALSVLPVNSPGWRCCSSASA